MYRGKVVSVVVPAYCEELQIETTLKGVPDWVDHVVVVDDASPDATFDRAAGVADERTHLLRNDVNLGVGGAVVAGHRKALELGAQLSVVMAGDGQMDPAHLPALLDPLIDDGYGYAKGNRFYAHDSFDGMPFHRVAGNLLLTFLTKASSGYWQIVDPQNGYTAVSSEVLSRLPLQRLRRRYEFENDMLIWLNILDVRVKDVPIPALYGTERSTLSLVRVVPRLLLLLFLGFWRRMWRKYVLWSFSPIALLVVVGTALLLFGLAVGVWATIQTIGPGVATAGTVLLAVTPFLTGTQMLVQAMALDIQATPK